MASKKEDSDYSNDANYEGIRKLLEEDGINPNNFNRLKIYLTQYYCGFVSASQYGNSPEENDKLTSDLQNKLMGLRFGKPVYQESEGVLGARRV